MTLIRIQASHQGISGLPEDQYINTFYASIGASLPATFTALATAVGGFYTAAPTTGGFPLGNFMGGLADSGFTIKMYDMADAMPRTPVFTSINPLPPSFGTGSYNLPEELAVCLSYQGDTSTGLPVARRRGRIYIGPLCSEAVSTGGLSAPAVVSSGIRTIATKKAKDLAADFASASAQWVVYSPTAGVSTPIVTAWVDDAFDIQRRRGMQPTTRTTVAIP